jgi:hypothetical protein
MTLTIEDRREIYHALDAEVDKLHNAHDKASKALRATNYASPVAVRELLSVRERQARAAYRAAFEVAAEYFDTYLMND